MRKIALLSVALMVVLAGCGSFTGGPAPETTETGTPTPSDGTPGESPTATPDQLPDADENTTGYVNGVWYNQSLDIDASGGLDKEALNKLKYRTMARLEVIRGLQFTGDVPVTIKTREEYQQELKEDGTFDFSETERVHQNVKWQATFMVDKQTNAVDELKSFYAGGVLGYYDPGADQIVVISPEGEEGVPSGLDEMTLAHELVHALQDQQFNISQPKYQGSTTESNNAVSGLIEGDASYVETLYKQRCDSGEWECLEQPDRSGGGGDYNFGIWATKFAPYSEGPSLIKEIHEEQGWAAVNEMYENPPASTSQLIHHDMYPDQKPVDVSIEDRSNDQWSVPQIEGGVNYASFGEAGLYAMFWYASYEATQENGRLTNVVVDYRDFVNQGPDGELDPIEPYDYGHEITDGLKGDKLLPYATDGGKTGFVWKLQWASSEDAQQFVDGYRQLLAHHGAEQAGSNTYRIADGERFEGAYSISTDGSTVVVVNAPSTDELDEIRDGAGS